MTLFINDRPFIINKGNYTEDKILETLRNIFNKYNEYIYSVTAPYGAEYEWGMRGLIVIDVSMENGCITLARNKEDEEGFYTDIKISFPPVPNRAPTMLGFSNKPNGDNISIVIPMFKDIYGDSENGRNARVTAPFQFISGLPNRAPSPKPSPKPAPSIKKGGARKKTRKSKSLKKINSK